MAALPIISLILSPTCRYNERLVNYRFLQINLFYSDFVAKNQPQADTVNQTDKKKKKISAVVDLSIDQILKTQFGLG